MLYCLVPIIVVYALVGFGVGRAAFRNLRIPYSLKWTVALVDGLIWPLVILLGGLDRADELNSKHSLTKYDLKK